MIAGVLAIALGVVSFGTAVLPIGTWLVWIPVAIWLSCQGETGCALFTTVLGIIINLLDNVLQPLLTGHGAASGYSINWSSDEGSSRNEVSKLCERAGSRRGQ